MDTHITSTPDLDGIGAPLGSPIRLPGERGTLPHLEPHDGTLPPTLEHQDDGSINQPPADEAQAAAATAKPRPSRRRWLLGTVAAVVLLAGTGGVLWLQRHGMVNLPLPASLASTVSATRGMPTGAAVMPATIAEVGGPAVPAVKQTAAPARASAPAPAVPSISPDMTDFAAFKNANGPSEVGARPTARPTSKPADASSPSSAPGEAGIAVTPPAMPSSVAVASLSAPAIPAQAATPVPAPVAPPKPRDPIQTAIDLRADPMSPKQQVDAVGLVRELGAQLKDTRLTVAQLSETVADLKQQLEARTADFDSRLTLSEAGTVLAESAKAGGATHPLSTTQPGAPSRAVPATRLAAGPVPSPAPTPAHASSTRTVKDFRIQGASPGLAVLNVLAPAAGEAPVLYLSLGDQVPGLGRIKTISQRGTSWVVLTDGGLIQ
jgi:hypothetical protein